MKAFVREYWFEAVLSFAGLAVVALGFGTLVLGAHLGGSEHRAQIGDFVGGVSTPILTALTFIGVLVGIALQRRELIATRKELKQSRIAAAKSAISLESQAKILEKQNFERTFFEQLTLLNQIVDSISTRYWSGNEFKTVSGRESFEILHRSLTDLEEVYKLSSFKDFFVSDILDIFFEKKRSELAAFFRTLYNIYRFIDESSFREEKLYGRMLRSQIADFSQPLIFYNSLTEYGQKMQYYIRRYDILDNMPGDLLLREEHEALIEKMPSKIAVNDWHCLPLE